MQLAAASLSLLLHRPIEPAQVTADRFEALQNADITAMPADLRADLLLLRSDIAVANADLPRARESLEAARTLLGDSELTALRLRRIETVASDPPRPPSQGSAYDTSYGSGTFEERMQRYRERLARYEKEQAGVRDRDSLRASEAAATKQAALDQAKQDLATGIAALSAGPAPFDDSLPPTQSAVAGARSLVK
jgi:hypothetical protein